MEKIEKKGNVKKALTITACAIVVLVVSFLAINMWSEYKEVSHKQNIEKTAEENK